MRGGHGRAGPGHSVSACSQILGTLGQALAWLPDPPAPTPARLPVCALETQLRLFPCSLSWGLSHSGDVWVLFALSSLSF